MAASGKADPDRTLSDSELNHAFAATSSTNETWLALLQLLRDHIIAAMNDVGDVSAAQNHGSLAHAAGGLEYLGRFQRELAERFEAAHSSNSSLV